MKVIDENKYEQAKKRVEEEKKFYSHLTAFITVNIALLIFKFVLLPYMIPEVKNEAGFTEWLKWHTIGTPVLWGIGLAIHALWTFRRKFFAKKTLSSSIFSKEWEKRKIEKLMKEDEL